MRHSSGWVRTFVVGNPLATEINPVARYGFLKVAGPHLHDQYGHVVQLRGISSHGLQWYPQFINPVSFAHLRDHWRIDVIRLAMYLDEGGYAENRAVLQVVTDGIRFAIDAGLYVVVDWHVHEHDKYDASGDPRKYEAQAVEFFTSVATQFGSHPNLIYEIANEPRGVSWQRIREYASAVIPAIRSIDKSNLIVVGTPEWSQGVDAAERDRLSDLNIAYALHFYAGSHPDLRKLAKDVLDKGLPLFVTEWGTTESSGTGGVHEEEAAEWMRFLHTEKISWINWSLSDKREDSALLRHATTTSGPWPTGQLTASGLLVKAFLLSAKL
jgi:endoglucanase